MPISVQALYEVFKCESNFAVCEEAKNGKEAIALLFGFQELDNPVR